MGAFGQMSWLHDLPFSRSAPFKQYDMAIDKIYLTNFCHQYCRWIFIKKETIWSKRPKKAIFEHKVKTQNQQFLPMRWWNLFQYFAQWFVPVRRHKNIGCIDGLIFLPLSTYEPYVPSKREEMLGNIFYCFKNISNPKTKQCYHYFFYF